MHINHSRHLRMMVLDFSIISVWRETNVYTQNKKTVSCEGQGNLGSNVYLRSANSNNLSAGRRWDEGTHLIQGKHTHRWCWPVARWRKTPYPETRNFCFGHNLTACQAPSLMVIWVLIYWHSRCSAYVVSVPHLDNLRVCRNHQIHLLMEMEGVDGKAIIMVFHKQGTRGTQVIQQNLERQWHIYFCGHDVALTKHYSQCTFILHFRRCLR